MENEHPSNTAVSRQRPKLLRKVVVAITGSVGAAEMPRFLMMLRKIIAEEACVLLSASAQRFISPYVTTLYSGSPTIAELYSMAPLLVPHIQATRGADVLVVMPATANIIGKVAHGVADELVSAAIMAASCPVVFVPNMNRQMWENPAVRRNVATVMADGYHMIDPTWGTEVADLEPTFGAMPAFSVVLKRLASFAGIQVETMQSLEGTCQRTSA